jgi:hypothetical protein
MAKPPREPSAKKSKKNQPAAPKKRSPLERAVVWGGIGILLVIVVIEASAQRQFTSLYTQIDSELKKSMQSGISLPEENVRAILKGRQPDATKIVKQQPGEERYEIYKFNGLLKRRVFCVRFEKANDTAPVQVLELMPSIPDLMNSSSN